MVSKKRQRILIERPLVPTPERQQKLDYETVKDGKKTVRRKANIFESLKKSGKLTCEMEEAANGWVKDYLFAFENYNDPKILEIVSADREDRSDVHVRNLHRGKARDRINLVRSTLGPAFHRRLVLILIEGISFKALGEILFPRRKDGRLGTEMSILAETILSILPNVYAKACADAKKSNEPPAGPSW